MQPRYSLRQESILAIAKVFNATSYVNFGRRNCSFVPALIIRSLIVVTVIIDIASSLDGCISAVSRDAIDNACVCPVLECWHLGTTQRQISKAFG
jgi:hypothetical protein